MYVFITLFQVSFLLIPLQCERLLMLCTTIPLETQLKSNEWKDQLWYTSNFDQRFAIKKHSFIVSIVCCWCWEVTNDGLASHQGEVKILLVISFFGMRAFNGEFHLLSQFKVTVQIMFFLGRKKILLEDIIFSQKTAKIIIKHAIA